VDLLTTNETHFFREARHFELLQGAGDRAASRAAAAARVERGVLERGGALQHRDDARAGLGGRPWEIVASDISTRVLERARSGHYAMARAKTIPREHLAAYCLKGTGPRRARSSSTRSFATASSSCRSTSTRRLPGVGEFDAIFLRNVMIYFDVATKREVISRLVRHLRPGGLPLYRALREPQTG
jgi:chemotaxis protein methyltransferase CheR